MDRQQELFNDFKDSDAEPKVFGKGLFPERSFTLILTYERMIVAAIIFIVVLAVVFAFGFEFGKKSVFTRRALVARVINNPAAPLPAPASVNEPKIPAPKTKPYTVLVSTFKSKQYAQQEALRLRQRGFSPTLVGINGLYQLWAGEYSDMKEASQALSALRKFYKDCTIRKR